MTVEIPPTPEHVLAVGAHPDDIDFMAGGTLARWAAAGAEVTYLVLTDGAAGSRDPEMSHERLIELREQEQRAAADAVGARDVIFLKYPDGRLQHTLELRFKIARIIRQKRPDAIITGDPTVRWSSAFNYINHPDHIAAADATLAAIMPTANTLLAAPELLAEGLEPHDVKDVYLSSFGDGSTWVPLSEEDLARKVAGLREHRSQLGDWDAESMVRDWSKRIAEKARAAGIECEMAESFIRITLGRPTPEPEDDASELATQATS